MKTELNEALEMLLKLDKKSMNLFSEDLKAIAERIHTAYNDQCFSLELAHKQKREKYIDALFDNNKVLDHLNDVVVSLNDVKIIEDRIYLNNELLSPQAKEETFYCWSEDSQNIKCKTQCDDCKNNLK